MWTPPVEDRDSAASAPTSTWTPPAEDRDDAPTPKSLGGLAGNAISDVGQMAGGVMNTIAHPIDTVKNVATHLPEIGHSMLHSWGLDSADSGHRMQTLADESYQHPVSHLLDAASVAIPGLKAAGLMPEALEGANLAGKAGEVAGDASDALGRRAVGFTKAGLKNGGLEKANEATRYAIDNGIMGVGSTPKEMQAAREAAEAGEGAKIGDILQKEPGTFDQSSAAKRLEALRPRSATGEVLKGGKYDALNAEIDDSLKTIGAHGDQPMPWGDANELKKTVREGTNFSPLKDTGVNNVRKAVGGTFKDELDSQLENSMKERGADIQPFLDSKENYGHLKTLEKSLDNRVASTEGNRIIGPMDAAVGGVGALASGGWGALGAVLAKKAIEKFGLTGGAVLGRKISTLLANPAVAQKFGGVIDAAISGGPTVAATTVHLIEGQLGGQQ